MSRSTQVYYLYCISGNFILTPTHNTPAHSQRRLFGSSHLLHSYQKRGSNDYQKSGEVLRVRKPSRMVVNVFIRGLLVWALMDLESCGTGNVENEGCILPLDFPE